MACGMLFSGAEVTPPVVASGYNSNEYIHFDKFQADWIRHNTTVFASSTLSVRIGSFTAGQPVTVLGSPTNGRIRVRGNYRGTFIIGYVYTNAFRNPSGVKKKGCDFRNHNLFCFF